MRVAWLLVVGLLAASGLGAAKSVEVAVGLDEPSTGTAYLRYFPSTVVIEEGDAVTWKSNSFTPHTVTASNAAGGTPAEAFESSPAFQLTPQLQAEWFGPGGFLLPSQSFSHTFNQTGTYIYICKIHPGMVGTVNVVNGTQPTTSGPLPIGGGANQTVTPGWVHVVAGWGAGEATVDRFAPANITVTVDTTVVWSNLHTAEPHTVTGFAPGVTPPAEGPPTAPPAFDSSPNIRGEPPGSTGTGALMHKGGGTTQFAHTFDEAGTFTYQCRLHPGQWGTVVVLAKQQAAGNQTTGPSRTESSGSQVPGFELPALVAGLAVVALALRRRP